MKTTTWTWFALDFGFKIIKTIPGRDPAKGYEIEFWQNKHNRIGTDIVATVIMGEPNVVMEQKLDVEHYRASLPGRWTKSEIHKHVLASIKSNSKLTKLENLLKTPPTKKVIDDKAIQSVSLNDPTLEELKELLEIIPEDFLGPCAHGRDPYDRCEVCNGDLIYAMYREIQELKRKVIDLEIRLSLGKQPGLGGDWKQL